MTEQLQQQVLLLQYELKDRQDELNLVKTILRKSFSGNKQAILDLANYVKGETTSHINPRNPSAANHFTERLTKMTLGDIFDIPIPTAHESIEKHLSVREQRCGETSPPLTPDLFDASPIVTKKPRPISAALLRKGDIQRSKPRRPKTTESAMIGQAAIKCERPLKYETTFPVTTKPQIPVFKARRAPPKSASSSNRKNVSFSDQSRARSATSDWTMHGQQLLDGDTGAAVIGDLQNGFRDSIVALQKRIGIVEDGFVS